MKRERKQQCGHTMASSFIFVLLFIQIPTLDGHAGCSFNGNGDCSVNTKADETLELLNGPTTNSSAEINWRIRPQNIGFIYYLRTSDDGNDLDVRGIVKWKVQLKNWTPNDTVLEGFLVTILDHDTNNVVESYELTMSEPFEEFAKENSVLEMRLELDNVLQFNKRYDAKINILPLGKQAPASSFLSIMEKLEGEKCSAMTGLAERWAPHVMVDVWETTSEIEVSWQPAPSFLCIQTYEVILQQQDGLIINVTEVEVNLNQKSVNVTFGGIARDQMVQVKIRGKNSRDGGCACVNCNCITDKTKFFAIPKEDKITPIIPSSPSTIHHEEHAFTSFQIILLVLGIIVSTAILVTGCLCCKRYHKIVWKQKVAFSSLKSQQYPNRKIIEKKSYKIMLVCPEVDGRDYDCMIRIADAFRKSDNTVVCDRWKETASDVEENMIHWVYEQTQIADKIVLFHSSSHQPRCGVYEIVSNFHPCTDPRLCHIALNPESQKTFPSEVEYVMPRDHKLLEEAFGISIADPLVIDIPSDNLLNFGGEGRAENNAEEGVVNSKTHSTDSGVSSMSSNSSDSEGAVSDTLQSNSETVGKEVSTSSVEEASPLLQEAISVS